MATERAAQREQVRDPTRYIGDRIRTGRALTGLSQEKLGAALGVTFQQVQKYEKGTNRVAVSTLLAIAAELRLDIGYFLPPGAASSAVCAVELQAIRTDIAATLTVIDTAVASLSALRGRLVAGGERMARADREVDD